MVTPAVIWLAHRINALDRPGVRTVHSRPIARIGGVAIFLIGHDGDHEHTECQIAMTAEPSLEWAGQKGTLFGRLVDECDLVVTAPGTHLAS